MVTLGSFLKVLEEPGFDPANTAFMMPTANGPCRFGQYKNLLEKILEEKGLDDVIVVSPTSKDGYEGLGEHANHLVRLGWWSLVCADGLRKLLLQTRPYEINPGETDQVHSECLDLLCSVLEKQNVEMKERFNQLLQVMSEIKTKFDEIPANYTKDKPLIGVVGEIYCRLDDFSNAYLIRRIEKFGGEVWLASIAEWVFYTNFMHHLELKTHGQRFSKSMLGAVIKNKIQVNDEHKLLAPLHDRFIGYEEPKNIKSIVEPAEPYLPYWGALGEMVLNVGGSIYYQGKGGDGIIDISPFTCMNGIVCEAVYPKVSRDFDNFPIRSFYFDGTESDYDRDVEIFLELAQTYKRRKKVNRVYPPHFPEQ
jgi:predicted nucleotide-binding protein (sugar kinase/HSP70/actin superfamily)